MAAAALSFPYLDEIVAQYKVEFLAQRHFH
jgi:hypothetical protein